MPITRWLIIIAICMMLGFGNRRYALADPMQQTDFSLKVTILTAQSEVVVGELISWQITLTPQNGQTVRSIELQPGDRQVWAWPDGPQTIQMLNESVALNVAAVPLVSGELFLTLKANYTIDNRSQSQLVVGTNTVQARKIETLVEASLTAEQGTVQKGNDLPVAVWIHNRSPFTLTQVEARGVGTDLRWRGDIRPNLILPHQSIRHPLTATVTGEHPQPLISIDYAWTDMSDASHMRKFLVKGEPISITKRWYERLPDEVLSIIVGIVIGAAASLIPQIYGQLMERRRRKETNRQNVYGLLRLSILQSNYAADSGVAVSLESLETIFRQEGLYAVLEEDQLAANARSLWEKAERHNAGLNERGGPQRAQELRQVAQTIEARLRDRRREMA